MNIENQSIQDIVKQAVMQGVELGIQQATKEKALQGDTMTLSALMDEWFEAKRIEIASNTYGKYCILSKNHVIPAFGNMMLTAIKKPMVQSFINGLSDKGYAVETVKTIKASILNPALEYAEEMGYIDKNPCYKVKTPKRDYMNHKRATKDADLQRLMTVSRKHRLWIALPILFNTGMRRGEMLALRWDDVNFEGNYISINKSFSANCQTGKGILKAPKTKDSVRMIGLVPELKAQLLQYKQTQGECHTFVISQAKTDAMVNPNNFARLVRQWCKTAGVSGISSHIGRHTFATRLHQLGFDTKTIMHFTGHGNSQTLERFYLDRDAPDSPIILQALKALNEDAYSKALAV